ncbi:hypothetical protein BGZ92_010025 [Podila epicladia]|nr:hypothetical protein BGZ92_010025 [Podila epicladia]
MDHSHNDSQYHVQRYSNNTFTRRYYVYAGATIPCNGDDSPIDRNNCVSFPGKTGTSRSKNGDSGRVPSPSPLPSTSSLKIAHPQDRGWVAGEHHSPLRDSLVFDELIDSYSGDIDTAELVGASIKETTSSIASGDYQDKKCVPMISLRSAFVENVQLDIRAEGNSAETNTVFDPSVSTAHVPASTQPLQPRHQTKDRIKAIQDRRPVSARQVTSESMVHTRPGPPIRRFAFRKVVHQQSPMYLNGSSVTQSDCHLDQRLNQHSQVQSQPPKKMLAPRSRPSIFGAFSSSLPNPAPSHLVNDSDSGHRADEDITDRRVSEAAWHSTVSSWANTETISSCISDHSQANDSVLSAPRYVWTPTPEPRVSRIMGNCTYSSSSPCLSTTTTASAASASAFTTTFLPHTKKPRRLFSFNWISKKQPLDSSTVTSSTTSSLDVSVRTMELRCTCTKQRHCRFHKDLPGLPGPLIADRGDTVPESKYRFSRLGYRNNDKDGFKPKSKRPSILSTASLLTLVRGSSVENVKSASASWASKLKLKKGSKSDPTTTASTATSDAITIRTHRVPLICGIRERCANPLKVGPKTLVISAPIVVSDLQKSPRQLIPNVVQRALNRRAGHADHSRSSSMAFEWDGHSNVYSSPGTAHSTVAAPAASAMPKLGIPRYSPVMSASSPCLSMATTAPRPVQGVCHTSAVASAPMRHRPTIVIGPIPTHPTPVPLRDQGHQSMHEDGPSRLAADLVPKPAATSYEKEKMSFFEPFRMKNRNPSYISFHFDISHLEDQRLDQGIPRTSECQDENHPSEYQHLATIQKQLSTGSSGHCDQYMSSNPKRPVVEGAQDSAIPSHFAFPMFRRPDFLSSMPSLSLPSLLLPEFSSSKLNLRRSGNRSPLATSSSTLPLSSPVLANRDTFGSSENLTANLSRLQPHHFCHEGLQQPQYRDLEGGAFMAQRAADNYAPVLGESSSAQHTNSKEFPLLPPQCQFSRRRKWSINNRFSASSVSLPAMLTTVSTPSTSSPSPTFTTFSSKFGGHSLRHRSRPRASKPTSWWANLWSGHNSASKDPGRGKAVKETHVQTSNLHDMDKV